MEEHDGSTGLLLATNFTDEPLSSQTLACIRALILNPSTPDSTPSPIFPTLTRFLELIRDSVVLHPTLKLLFELSSCDARFSCLFFDSVRSHSLLCFESTCLAAHALNVVASIAERNPASVPAADELDDGLFASLCFRPSPSLRLWLLRNAERFRLRSYLGFTKDPYPCTGKLALDGFVHLSRSDAIEDKDMASGCYYHAVELLRDMEDDVWSAAVRAQREILVWSIGIRWMQWRPIVGASSSSTLAA